MSGESPAEPTPETALPSGHQFELHHGEQRAVITEVGAGLRSYCVGGYELLDTYAADEKASGGRGQVLAPWPGRIAQGRYQFEGQQLQLPINEVSEGNAIHGLVRWSRWAVASHESNRLVMELTLYPQPGYPFTLALRESYALTTGGLEVRTTARNLGQRPLPYGVGHHPYFTVGTDLVDEAVLHVPARSYLPAGEHLIPMPPAVPVQGSAFDFSTPRPIGELHLDVGYADLVSANGWTRVTLAAPGGRPSITLAADATHPFVQVYTGDTLTDGARRRRGVAIEPYTCAADAFNNGLGLRVLQPGEESSSVWRVEAVVGPRS